MSDDLGRTLRGSDDGISHFGHEEIPQRNVSATQGLDCSVPGLQVGRVRQWESSPVYAEGLLAPIID